MQVRVARIVRNNSTEHAARAEIARYSMVWVVNPLRHIQHHVLLSSTYAHASTHSNKGSTPDANKHAAVFASGDVKDGNDTHQTAAKRTFAGTRDFTSVQPQTEHAFRSAGSATLKKRVRFAASQRSTQQGAAACLRDRERETHGTHPFKNISRRTHGFRDVSQARKRSLEPQQKERAYPEPSYSGARAVAGRSKVVGAARTFGLGPRLEILWHGVPDFFGHVELPPRCRDSACVHGSFN